MTCGDLLKLSRRFYGADGNRKPDHYFEVYERYFAPFRHAPIDILEIGVADGISLRIWREYFSAANIIGIDTRGAPQGIAALIESQRVKHVVGDQSCPTDLEKCLSLSRSGKFDVVIDDASHIGALSKASFEFLFPRLVSGGLYFIEDYGTGYMGNFPDGGAIADFDNENSKVFPSHNMGMVGWSKQLIDLMHWSAIRPGEPPFLPIESITFWRSLALVKRG